MWVLSAGSQNHINGECDPVDGKMPRGSEKGKDGVYSSAGTSMSTPAVSGALALIRQYFREGFYPTGEKNPRDAILKPSGALLKAILLNGGQRLFAVDNGIFSETYPSVPYDNRQGFGRVSLIDTLYLKGKSNVNAVLFDRVKIQENEKKSFSVTVHKTAWCKAPTVSVTLTWMDKPGFTYCRQSCLMNDLDLHVTKDSNPDLIFYPNGRDSRDNKNTVERVQIPLIDLKNEEIINIFVTATNFESSDDSQKFAIATTGCIKERKEVPRSPTEAPVKRIRTSTSSSTGSNVKNRNPRNKNRSSESSSQKINSMFQRRKSRKSKSTINISHESQAPSTDNKIKMNKSQYREEYTQLRVNGY